MPGRPVASVLTLGCKLNLADSEAIAGRLTAAGYDVVDHLCEADAVVVNTCSVTHVADRKSRRLIRAARRLSPSAPVAVTGCYPRSAGTAAVEALGADFVAGTNENEQADLVAKLAAAAPAGGRAAAVPGPARLHTRAFVKAQEAATMSAPSVSSRARAAVRPRARLRPCRATSRPRSPAARARS